MRKSSIQNGLKYVTGHRIYDIPQLLQQKFTKTKEEKKTQENNIMKMEKGTLLQTTLPRFASTKQKEKKKKQKRNKKTIPKQRQQQNEKPYKYNRIKG